MQKYLATPTIIYNLIIHFYIRCTSDQVHSVGFFMFSTPRIYTSHPILPSILWVNLVPAPTKCRHLEEMDRRESDSTAGNTIIIYFTFHPHIDTAFNDDL